MPEAPAWATALEASPLGVAMRESAYLYPAANLIHLLGLTLLVGGILVLDLRLLGFGRGVPVPAASRLLTPLALVGLGLSLPSGFLMFAADAGPLAMHPLMLWKAALVALALLNAVAFRLLWTPWLDGWDARAARLGQAQAASSILLWLGVGFCGRMVAYV